MDSATHVRSIDTMGHHATWLLMALAIAGVATLMSVQEDGVGVALPLIGQMPELCMMKSQLGITCPGCGLTRSFISLVRGDLVSAWHYNPVGLLLFGILLYQIPYRLIAMALIASGRRLSGHASWVTSVLVFIIVGGLFAQWIWKFFA